MSKKGQSEQNDIQRNCQKNLNEKKTITDNQGNRDFNRCAYFMYYVVTSMINPNSIVKTQNRH